ncbi:hypothetical protein RFI_02327 [Reticulomyxa filosa]|uniref:Uncharacterized protein n=1 Tax=Reticulomyxa filosa TaxID=46433 RepID=X6P9G9_RETFI|nr:hypothetical protein RFI_02327 [Reticulomyxa filosa]|eukprot:ETO34763.1 hypothetical protein RFI_02327 [Reticulomyxa filosa]
MKIMEKYPNALVSELNLPNFKDYPEWARQEVKESQQNGVSGFEMKTTKFRVHPYQFLKTHKCKKDSCLKRKTKYKKRGLRELESDDHLLSDGDDDNKQDEENRSDLFMLARRKRNHQRMNSVSSAKINSNVYIPSNQNKLCNGQIHHNNSIRHSKRHQHNIINNRNSTSGSKFKQLTLAPLLTSSSSSYSSSTSASRRNNGRNSKDTPKQTKEKKRRSFRKSVDKSALRSIDSESRSDSDNPDKLWCVCQRPSSGLMIECEKRKKVLFFFVFFSN